MKVLIADKLSDDTVAALERLGLEVRVEPELTDDALPDAIGNANIIVVRSTKVTAAAFAAGSQLSLVIRAGAGVNTIDLQSACDRGIYVANCPGKNTAAVAELAIGLLIAADRRICDATLALRCGRWEKKEFGKAGGLKGRTLGILGFGNIGRAVAERALGLGMKVVAWSRSLTEEIAHEHGVQRADSSMALAAKSDAVSVHLAFTPDTKHLVGKAFLDAMRPGAILVNTSRGELVDSEALKAAIVGKSLRVGLDVFEDEPAGGAADFAQTELAAMVTATPHVGASTDQAAEAIAAQVVRIVESFIKTGHPLDTVNLCDRSPATHSLVIRHLNRVGILAGVLDGLREEGINVEEVENTIFEGAKAACCAMLLDQSPSQELLDSLKNNDGVLHVMLNSH